MERIAVGADHGGFALKEQIKGYLQKKGFKVKDVGTYSKELADYPVFAFRAAQEVSCGRMKRAVIICKSGIGNSIAANKLHRVRAALCYNVRAAVLSRRHNDSNVLVLGSLFVNPALAKRIVSAWLGTDFEGGRHSRRLAQIRQIEEGKWCKER